MSFTGNLNEIVEANENKLLSKHPTWSRVPLGLVSNLLNGYPFDSKKFDKNEGVPVIRIRDIMSSSTDTNFIGELPDGYWVSRGEILVGMDGDFNVSKWCGEKSLLNQRVCKLTPDAGFVNQNFYFYTLGGYLKAINAYTSSVTVKHLSSKTILEIPLPYPPLAEQKRIADKLDATLARVDACRERLARVAPILKRFRQSVLAAATSGQLTADWRAQQGHGHAGNAAWADENSPTLAADDERCSVSSNVTTSVQSSVPCWTGQTATGDMLQSGLAADCKAVYASTVAGADEGSSTSEAHGKRWASQAQPNLRATNSLPVGWDKTNAGAILKGKPRNGYSPKSVDYKTDIKTLALSATTSGRFKAEFFKYVNEEIPEDSYLWLEPGDILIQRANSMEYVGVSAIYDGSSAQFIYPDLMMKCQPNERTNSKFLHILFSSETTRKFFRDNATGTAGNMPKINQQTVMSAPVSLPPLIEQTEIVRRVETLFAFADRLEARLASATTAAERLTPSLLAKAFRGELVPQDANDEPASELLQRLAASRVGSKPKRGKKASG